MNELWKTLLTSPVLAAFIVGFSAWFTAWRITKRTEEKKLDVQVAVEQNRLLFQEHSDVQKQRMELSKLMYVEKLLAGKALMGAAGTFWDRVTCGFYESDFANPVETERYLADFALRVSENGWLLSTEVGAASVRF